MAELDPLALLTPRRKITGMSAILLPFQQDGEIDWPGFDAHVSRTLEAGLTPAVNMDTGYGHLIAPETRAEVLRRTRSIASGAQYVAGVFVHDAPESRFDAAAYAAGIDQIQTQGGTPILFQSYGLVEQSDQGIVEAYQQLSRHCDSFLAFELGSMFAPFGKIYSLEVYEQLLAISNCAGAKHSSLSRMQEWQRLSLKRRVRPDFMVLTGNDLAIDMVIYGSDYLLGLSTFAPEAFAKRDALWASGSPAFYELNDLLQYLGAFTFRPPVPAYKHSAAMFLHLRGWIQSNLTHPQSPARPDSDLIILENILQDLERLL
ncbi:MAG: dihydrodipicolinate synthase family protein [Novipirellula sp. JB048]